jgi:shikimate dehydrogenase
MKRTGLTGYPIAHSLSPALHNAVYRELGLDWEYGLYPCVDETAFLALIAELRAEWVGLNVTTPYKPQAFAACECLLPDAEASGAVNVLTAGAVLTGDNTDGRGLLAALARATGITLAGTHFVICGNGSVTGSIVAALKDKATASITVLSRRAAPGTQPYSKASEVLATADVLIDATTLGMQPHDGSALPLELLRPDLVVVDTVYGHGQTALIKAARAIGAPAFDGLGMLVEQAALTIEDWLAAQGIIAEVPRDLMYTIARG